MIQSHSAAEGCIGLKQPGRHYRRSRLSRHHISADWVAMMRGTAVLAFNHWRGIWRRPLDAQSLVGRVVVVRGLVSSLLVGLLVGFWTGPVWAKAYGNFDIRELLVPSPTPGAGGSLNPAFLDGVLADLSEHAASYPPQFDSPADMQRAQKDARNLIGMLNTVVPNGVAGVFRSQPGRSRCCRVRPEPFPQAVEHRRRTCDGQLPLRCIPRRHWSTQGGAPVLEQGARQRRDTRAVFTRNGPVDIGRQGVGSGDAERVFEAKSFR